MESLLIVFISSGVFYSIYWLLRKENDARNYKGFFDMRDAHPDKKAISDEEMNTRVGANADGRYRRNRNRRGGAVPVRWR